MIVGAERSHDLSYVHWRPRKAGGIILSKFKGLWTRGADGISQNLRAGKDEMRCLSSNSKAGRKGQIPTFSALCSYSGPPWIRRGPPTLPRTIYFTESLIQTLVSCRNTLTDTPKLFNLDTLWPVKAMKNEPSQVGINEWADKGGRDTLSTRNSLSKDVSQQKREFVLQVDQGCWRIKQGGAWEMKLGEAGASHECDQILLRSLPLPIGSFWRI